VRRRPESVEEGIAEAQESPSQRLASAVKRSIKRLLPPSMVQEIRKYLAYERSERSIYLRMRLAEEFGLSNLKLARPPITAYSFVFVCFGNIMRSPMCEALMKRACASLPEGRIKVTSAGLNAAPGRAAHTWAVAAAREFGISLEGHRARLLTAEMVEQADAIFAMDYQNRAQLCSRWPGATEKVFMLSAYAGDNYRPVEIADPYYEGQEGTLRCYQILQACIANLTGSLFREPQVEESRSKRSSTDAP
jgi:protein-tyrosine phosphatase